MTKKTIIFFVLVILTVILSACSKSEFRCTDNTEKSMTVTAKNAKTDDFFMTGTLEVTDNEKLIIDSSLEKGNICLEFVSPSGMNDIEKIPDVDTDPQLTVEVSETETQEYEIGPGSYLLKATVVEKATGTIAIDVQSSETM